MTHLANRHGPLPELPADDHETPVVVMLHGRGGSPQSAHAFAPAFPGATLLCPQGGLREGPGFAWFRNKGIGIADFESLHLERESLEAWIDATCGTTRDIWLAGFSNGAAMAGTLALARPARYRGLIMVSGPLVDEKPWPPGGLGAMSVLFVRGISDMMIPAFAFDDTGRYLETLPPVQVEFVRYNGEHEPTASALREIAAWFKRKILLTKKKGA